MDRTKERRGRPRVGDASEMSAIGLRLMIEHGWSTTTMAEIASACGVSTPTLFRYFPTKAELLWYGMERNAELLRTRFAARHETDSLADALTSSYAAMLHDSGQLALIKARMSLVSRDEEAAQAGYATYDQWRSLIIGLVAEFRNSVVSDVATRIAGAAIWAALWGAITAWASSEDAHPDEYVMIARDVVARLNHAAP